MASIVCDRCKHEYVLELRQRVFSSAGEYATITYMECPQCGDRVMATIVNDEVAKLQETLKMVSQTKVSTLVDASKREQLLKGLKAQIKSKMDVLKLNFKGWELAE